MTADAVGGVWTYVLDLAGGLAARGVGVTLATMGPPPSEAQRDAAEAVPALDLRVGAFDLEWMPNPWQDVEQAGKWLLEIEAKQDFDVVHLNGYAHGHLPFRAPVLVAGHSCVLSWFEAVKGEAAPPEFERYRSEVRHGLRSAGAVIAPSGAMLAALERHYGPLPAATVVHNGRDPSRFAPAAKESFILTAGRFWDEAKNLAALGAVAGSLAWPVLAAGLGQAPDGRQAGNSLRFLGTVPSAELAALMGRAAIFALPARYEPFGLAALEAALSGCALVLGDIPSLREVWGDAALFVPPDDHEALRATLATLITGPSLRKEMARRARDRAGTYTVEAMTGSTLAVYERFAKSNAPGRSREEAVTCA
jgi:glycogen(starch) synthase